MCDEKELNDEPVCCEQEVPYNTEAKYSSSLIAKKVLQTQLRSFYESLLIYSCLLEIGVTG